MKGNGISKRLTAFILAAAMAAGFSACGSNSELNNLAQNTGKDNKKTVNMFTPVGKSDSTATNVAQTAQQRTVLMAEERLGVEVNYFGYTADNYTEETYDEVLMKRAHSNVDDIYLLNPDVIQSLGTEGILADLSGLDCVDNLRDVVKVSNTVDGKLVAIPQEIVAYGLFVNKDMFDKYNLELPETPDELLECCRVFKENGIETPIGANRWWLECFVLAIGYAQMYNGADTEAEIAALNSGETKLSDYMRPGFEFLQTLIDEGYIDAEKAYTYEAIDGEGEDFKAGNTPIVMAYWGAANSDTAYGNVNFNMQVIGFPSSLGQMPVVSMSGYGVGIDAVNYEDAMDVMNVMLSDEALSIYAETNNVISPSVNVEVEYKDALKPLEELINSGKYVLGSNAGMKVEQWGNICLIVRKLLAGAGVEECMQEFDRLQDEI
jgi:raffinose/stachyose/melibiose transport system substrate-binding protein